MSAVCYIHAIHPQYWMVVQPPLTILPATILPSALDQNLTCSNAIAIYCMIGKRVYDLWSHNTSHAEPSSPFSPYLYNRLVSSLVAEDEARSQLQFRTCYTR